jgi:hypothetical protein
VSIDLGVPTLVSPDNHGAVPMGPCVFIWNPVVGATDYMLQVWIMLDSEQAYIFSGWMGGSIVQKTIQLTGTGGPVYWCVVATDGTYYMPSATWDFTVVSGYDATITARKLQYDGITVDIPYTAGTVPVNSSGKVIITVRNDSAQPALLGISATIKRPDGSTALTFSQQSGYVNPGSTYNFTSASFTLNQSGLWKVAALDVHVWDGDEWVFVGSTPSDLCTAGIPAYSAVISEKWLRYGGTNYAFGVNVPVNTSAQVQVRVTNTGVTAQIRIRTKVFNPAGTAVIDETYTTSSPLNSGATHTHNSPAFVLDMDGSWFVVIEVAVWNGSTWLAADIWPSSGQGFLCSVGGGGAPHVFQNLSVTYSKF